MILVPGLIFTNDQIRAARDHRNQPPFDAAWQRFETLATDQLLSADPLRAAVYDALRWRLLDDSDEGARAVESLSQLAYSSADADVDLYRQAFAAAQAFACIQDHPAFSTVVRTQILDWWLSHVDGIGAGDAPELRAWSALVGLCAGLLLDEPERAEMAAAQFRALIDSVQPHGYIPALVGTNNAQTLTRTLELIQALTLTAEVGAHHGFDLWGYELRGVSVMTAALYPLYYYYYPEKWPWSPKSAPDPVRAGQRSRRERASQTLSDLTLEPTQQVFREHASFLELVNRRAAQPVHAVAMILDELRPITDLLGGGAVTLTHAPPPPPKRRGLFGR